MDAQQREAVLGIVERAMALEVDDRELYDETLLWFRFNDEEKQRHRDGLILETSGVNPTMARFARRFLRPENWHSRSNRRRYCTGSA